MAAPPPCIEIPILAEPLTVRLPAGISITAFDLVDQLQTALAPLTPAVKTIEAVLAVFKAVVEIPGAIVTLDIDGLLKLVRETGKKVAFLFQLLPQLSLPLAIVDTLDAVIALLIQVRDDIERLGDEQLRIDAARATADALENEGARTRLLSVVACAEANVQIELNNKTVQLQAQLSLLSIVQVLLSLLGVDASVPDLSQLSGGSIDETVDALDAMIEALERIRGLIPL